MSRWLRRLGLVATLAWLGACDGTDSSATGPGLAPTSSAAVATSPDGRLQPTGSPSTPVEDLPTLHPAGKPILVTGIVGTGVESGCLILSTTSEVYQLLGASRSDLRTGSTVTVEGILRTNLASTCQQGKPLQVTEVRPE